MAGRRRIMAWLSASSTNGYGGVKRSSGMPRFDKTADCYCITAASLSPPDEQLETWCVLACEPVVWEEDSRSGRMKGKGEGEGGTSDGQR